jgi:hypothetical protein
MKGCLLGRAGQGRRRAGHRTSGLEQRASHQTHENTRRGSAEAVVSGHAVRGQHVGKPLDSSCGWGGGARTPGVADGWSASMLNGALGSLHLLARKWHVPSTLAVTYVSTNQLVRLFLVRAEGRLHKRPVKIGITTTQRIWEFFGLGLGHRKEYDTKKKKKIGRAIAVYGALHREAPL